MKTRGVIFAFFLLALAAMRTPAQAGGDGSRVEKGAALYRAYCQPCHGRDASEPAPGVKNLRAFEGDEETFAVIVKNGRNAMPAHSVLSEDDLAALYAYVKSE